MTISNNVSSIQYQQQSLNSSAVNISNMGTAKNNQADLANEIPKQIIAQGASSANVSAIRTQDEMLGSLLDIKA